MRSLKKTHGSGTKHKDCSALSLRHAQNPGLRRIVVLLTICLVFAGFSQSASAGDLVVPDSTEQIPVRGVVRPEAKASLAAEIGASVISIGYLEGETFNKNDVLIGLDCRRFEAQLAAVRANLVEAEARFNGVSVLMSHHAVSQQEFETAKARRDGARAEVEVAEIQVESCTIRAPFDGKVAELGIHLHETTIPGQPIIHVLSDNNPTIELIVPSTWLTWISIGTHFKFEIDETGQSADAEVVRLGAEIDAVSQTTKLFARFIDPPAFVISGMSGTASFTLKMRGGFDG